MARDLGPAYTVAAGSLSPRGGARVSWPMFWRPLAGVRQGGCVSISPRLGAWPRSPGLVP